MEKVKIQFFSLRELKKFKKYIPLRICTVDKDTLIVTCDQDPVKVVIAKCSSKQRNGNIQIP